MSSQSYAIHWFRRDLRVAGNSALEYAVEKYNGRVLGFFCFDSEFLARPDFSATRFAFFISTLKVLKTQMQEQGGDLLVLDRPPLDAFRWVIKTAKQTATVPSLVVFNRDYEPFARKRDAAVQKMLVDEFSIPVETQSDHLLIEPTRLLEGLDRGPYQVFSPFQRRWLEVFQQEGLSEALQARVSKLDSSKKVHFCLQWKSILKEIPDALTEFERRNAPKVTIPLPAAGQTAALAKIDDFVPRSKNYSQHRDLPAVKGTSGLSIYFKNGSLTVGEAIGRMGLKAFGKKAESGRDKFLSELIWREFYYHILYHFPQVETVSFQERYENLKWQNNEKWFTAWKEGQTGYPLVDAGMRQLKQWGWMHNRVRMVVASFLTKDLLIDYRWGERHFMQLLLDGDLAPNNGGWQWAASTGCDPQPYFRIFNPYLQSRKFDPKGDYIRRYIPELKHLDAKQIHEPPPTPGYPLPIVDHRLQRDKALQMYNLVLEKK